jgi:transposase
MELPQMTAQTQNPDEMLSPKQIEDEYGIKQQTQAVWRCNDRHGWPYTKVGRSVRTRRRDLERWLSERTVNGGE